MVAFTSGYDRSFTDVDFLGSFFMGMGIISFGLYVDVNAEDTKNYKHLKNNKRYRLTVLAGLILICLSMSGYVYYAL
jgi:small-conductance mechanosensitive channel